MNSENMSNHSSTKNFGKFQCKLQPADVVCTAENKHAFKYNKVQWDENSLMREKKITGILRTGRFDNIDSIVIISSVSKAV